MNEPIGRFGSCRPARARRTAVDDGMHRLGLADDALAQLVLHAEQLVALALQHLVDGNAGPARHDMRDVVGRDGLLDEVAGAALLCFRFGQLLLKVGDDAVGDLAGLGEVAAPLRGLQVEARLVEALLQLGGGTELLLLRLPALR